MSEKVEWKKQEERGAGWAFRTTLLIYRIFGRRICSLIVFPVGCYFCMTGGESRKASIDFLNRVYEHESGKHHFKRKPGIRESLRHFLSFSFTVLDKFAVWIGRIKYDQIIWTDRESFVKSLKPHGVVLLSAHYGNLEIMRAVSQLMTNMKVNVIMDKKNAEAFNRLLKSTNEKAEVAVFATEDVDIAVTTLLKKKLDEGEMVAIMADRMTDGSAGRIERRKFLGETACFPQGPFVLAAILKAPVYMFMCTKKKQKFHVNAEKMCDSDDFSGKKRNVLVDELCSSYVENLEKHCLNDPWQWFNFYDFWKNIETKKSTVKSDS